MKLVLSGFHGIEGDGAWRALCYVEGSSYDHNTDRYNVKFSDGKSISVTISLVSVEVTSMSE